MSIRFAYFSIEDYVHRPKIESRPGVHKGPRGLVPLQVVKLTYDNSLALVCLSFPTTAITDILERMADILNCSSLNEAKAAKLLEIRTIRVEGIVSEQDPVVVALSFKGSATTQKMFDELKKMAFVPPPNAVLVENLLNITNPEARVRELLRERKKEEKEEAETPAPEEGGRMMREPFRPPFPRFPFEEEEEREKTTPETPLVYKAVIGALTATASLFFPPVAGVMVGLAHEGWIITASFFFSYAVWFARTHLPIGIGPMVLIHAVAIAVYLIGIHDVYSKHHLNFEVWEAINRWWRLATTPKGQKGETKDMAVQSGGLFESITDLITLIGIAGIFFPMLMPVAGSLLLFSLARERHQMHIQHLYIIPAVGFRIAGILGRNPIDLIMSWLCLVVSYFPAELSISFQLNLSDLKNLKELPKILKARFFPTYELPEVPEALKWAFDHALKTNPTLRRDMERAMGGDKRKMYLLKHGILPYELKEETDLQKKRIVVYATDPSPIVDIHTHEIRDALLAYYTGIGVNAVPSGRDEILVSRLCLPSVQKECIKGSIPPVRGEISEEKLSFLIPVGTTCFVDGDSGSHTHYPLLYKVSPDVSSHLLVVAPTGGGKSFLLSSIMKGFGRIYEDYPVFVIPLEGKAESHEETEANLPPYMAFPYLYLSSPAEIQFAISSIYTLIEMRQKLFNLLRPRFPDVKARNMVDFFRGIGVNIPLIMVILDEFWQMAMVMKGMREIKVTTKSGETLKYPASQFVLSALTTIVILARAIGVSLVFATQSARKEAIHPALRDNTTIIMGRIADMSQGVVVHALGGHRERILREMGAVGLSFDNMPQYTFLVPGGPFATGEPPSPPSWAIFLSYDPRKIPEPSKPKWGGWGSLIESLGKLFPGKSREEIEALAKMCGIIPPKKEEFLGFGRRGIPDIIKRLRVEIQEE